MVFERSDGFRFGTAGGLLPFFGFMFNGFINKVSRQEPSGFLLSHLTLIQSACKARLCEKKYALAERKIFFGKPRRGPVFPANGLFRNLLLKMPTHEFWGKKISEGKRKKGEKTK